MSKISREGVQAAELAGKLSSVCSGSRGQIVTYAAMLLLAQVLDQCPAQLPEKLADLRVSAGRCIAELEMYYQTMRAEKQ